MNKKLTLAEVTQGNFFRNNDVVTLPDGSKLRRQGYSAYSLLNTEVERVAKIINMDADTLIRNVNAVTKYPIRDYYGDKTRKLFSEGSTLNDMLKYVWANYKASNENSFYFVKEGCFNAVKLVLKKAKNVYTSEDVKPFAEAGLLNSLFHKTPVYKAGDVLIVEKQFDCVDRHGDLMESSTYQKTPYTNKKIFKVGRFRDDYVVEATDTFGGMGIKTPFVRYATQKEIEDANPKLPIINGHEGKIQDNYIVYGCAKMPISWFKQDAKATRTLREITLSSNVKINNANIQLIEKYLKNLK